MTNARARPTPLILGHLLVEAALRLRGETAVALQALALEPRAYGLLNQVVIDDGATQARLGELLRIDRTTMVAMLDALAAAGWVVREADAADRRVYRIRVTESGRRIHEKATRAVEEVERRFLAPLSAAQVQALSSALRALRG